MTEHEQLLIQQGEQARLLLDNPTLVGAFAALMNRYHDNIALTRDDDVAQRETLFRKMRACQEVLAELKASASTGAALAQQYAEAAEGAASDDNEE